MVIDHYRELSKIEINVLTFILFLGIHRGYDWMSVNSPGNDSIQSEKKKSSRLWIPILTISITGLAYLVWKLFHSTQSSHSSITPSLIVSEELPIQKPTKKPKKKPLKKPLQPKTILKPLKKQKPEKKEISEGPDEVPWDRVIRELKKYQLKEKKEPGKHSPTEYRLQESPSVDYVVTSDSYWTISGSGFEPKSKVLFHNDEYELQTRCQTLRPSTMICQGNFQYFSNLFVCSAPCFFLGPSTQKLQSMVESQDQKHCMDFHLTVTNSDSQSVFKPFMVDLNSVWKQHQIQTPSQTSAYASHAKDEDSIVPVYMSFIPLPSTISKKTKISVSVLFLKNGHLINKLDDHYKTTYDHHFIELQVYRYRSDSISNSISNSQTDSQTDSQTHSRNHEMEKELVSKHRILMPLSKFGYVHVEDLKLEHSGDYQLIARSTIVNSMNEYLSTFSSRITVTD